MKRIILLSALAFTALTTYGVISYYQHIDDPELAKLYESKKMKAPATIDKEELTTKKIEVPVAEGTNLQTKVVSSKRNAIKVKSRNMKLREKQEPRIKTVTATLGKEVDDLTDEVMKKKDVSKVDRTTVEAREVINTKDVVSTEVYEGHADKDTKEEEKKLVRKVPRKLEFSKFSRAAIDYEAQAPPLIKVMNRNLTESESTKEN